MFLTPKGRPFLTRTADQITSVIWRNFGDGKAISIAKLSREDQSIWANNVPMFLRNWCVEDGQSLEKTFGHMV